MFQRYIYLCGKAKKRIPDNDYLVYKREKEYASKRRWELYFIP